eukprot:4156710-Prymnesium_polylepis.2
MGSWGCMYVELDRFSDTEQTWVFAGGVGRDLEHLETRYRTGCQQEEHDSSSSSWLSPHCSAREGKAVDLKCKGSRSIPEALQKDFLTLVRGNYSACPDGA